jgi:hypothetical protein
MPSYGSGSTRIHRSSADPPWHPRSGRGRKRRSGTRTPSGPGPHDTKHIADQCIRKFQAGSVSPIALVLSNPDLDLFKAPGS